MRLSAPTWRKAVGETEMGNWPGSAPSHVARPVKLEYHLLLARDLQLLSVSDHDQLSLQATEIKRMLTALIQKLSAESLRRSRAVPPLG